MYYVHYVYFFLLMSVTHPTGKTFTETKGVMKRIDFFVLAWPFSVSLKHCAHDLTLRTIRALEEKKVGGRNLTFIVLKSSRNLR